MTIADVTLVVFTVSNSLRIVAYVPRITKAARDRSGAEAISFGTWGVLSENSIRLGIRIVG
jgi:hypothetical protein